MWDFKIGQAFKLILRTLPFIGLRMLVYAGIALGYMLVTGIGAGIGYGVGTMGGGGGQAAGAGWGGLFGFVVFGGIMYWAREYILYLVKAGHIAVLVKMIDGEALPDGKAQLSYGTAVVKQRFAQSSVLFLIDRLIKGVVHAISGLARGMLRMLPGGDGLANLVRGFLRVALGFVDELILARMIRAESEEPWDSAKNSLILYGQNYKMMLKNAAWLAVIMYGLTTLVFLLMLAPAALVVYLVPGIGSVATFVFAILLAWSVKAALFEPLALTCMMQVYFAAIDGQKPNPEWDAKLEKMSRKFRKIKEKAASAVQGKAVHDAQPVPEQAS